MTFNKSLARKIDKRQFWLGIILLIIGLFALWFLFSGLQGNYGTLPLSNIQCNYSKATWFSYGIRGYC